MNEPGIELDIAVAKVIGLTVYASEWSLPAEGDRSNVCAVGPLGLQRYYLDCIGIWQPKTWSPSTDIAVAMGLFKIEWILTSMDIGHKLWVVYRDISELESGAAVGESNISAAHAISLAIVNEKRIELPKIGEN